MGTRGRSKPEILAIGAVLVSLVTVLALRIGPALVGAKTFTAVDKLSAANPWWNGGASPSVLNPFLGDSIDSRLPSYLQIHERLMQGDWALWSSLGGAGNDLLSSTTMSTLTLSTFWYLILPTIVAPAISKLAEIVLAMAGMYLWMRRIGLGRPAGLLGGVFYCGSGFFVGWATWSSQSAVAAMMPALFWAIEYLIAKKTLRHALPIALVVALLLLGGFPAVAGHTLYAGGLYFIVRLILTREDDRGRSTWRVFFIGVGAVVLGLALSAVQTVPMAMGLSDTDLSVRSDQFFEQQPPGSLLSMFFPTSMFTLGYDSTTNPIEAYAFMGIGAVFFALVAILTPRLPRQGRGVVPFLTVGTLLAAAIVWQQGWWTAWMSGLPIFNGNNSGRLRDIVCLFLAALAAIGVERVFTASRPVRGRLIVITGVAGIIFAGLTLVMWKKYPNLPTATLVMDALPGLLIIAAAGIVILFAGGHIVRTICFIAVALLAALQMYTSVSNYWPLSDTAEFYPDTALITAASDHIRDGRVLSSHGFMGSTASAYGLRSVTAHAFQPESWRDYLKELDLGAFGDGQSPTNPAVTFPGEETDAQARLLDRLSATIWVAGFSAPIPGEITTATGQQIAQPDDQSSIVIEADRSLDQAASLNGIRGVSFDVLDEVVPVGADATFTVEILDDAGEVLADGSIVRQHFSAGTVTIAVAGEDIVSDDLTLRVTSSEDVELAADASGVIDVSVIRPADDGLALVYADAHGSVWAREGAMPRIRWGSETEIATGSAEQFALLKSPELPDSAVVLAEDGPPASGADAELVVEEDSGDVIRVQADAAGAGYLVVADWMHRGWSASVDGEPVDIVSADFTLSAVYVDEGEHEIVFTYVGDGLSAGALISSGAILVIVVILGLAWFRSRNMVKAE